MIPFEELGIPKPDILSGEIGKGWWPIVKSLHEEIYKLDPDYQLVQVKEKFGGLRYYIRTSDGMHPDDYQRIRYLVNNAETISLRTCEDCGAQGEQRYISQYWIKTLCESCHEKKVQKGTEETEKEK